jgi:hypothetical protein
VEGACKEPLCLARRTWFHTFEYEDADTEYYATKTMAQALVDSSMAEGTTYDLTPTLNVYKKIYTLGKVGKSMARVSPTWGYLKPQVIASDFYESCITGGRVTLDLEKYLPEALACYAQRERLSKKDQSHAFTVVHMGAPNGVIVQIRMLFDGKQYHGQNIPPMLGDLLKNKGVQKFGFGVVDDVEHLRVAGFEVNTVCDLHSVVLMLWPQLELARPKTSKWFVKEKLRSPCPIYKAGQDKPEGGLKIRYEAMDFALPVDQWDPLWSYYNAMDNYLAHALVDYASARAADLDDLSSKADVVRYALDILDAVRDLPKDPMGSRRHKRFDRIKEETDEMRGKQMCWPLTTDYDVYVRFGKRWEYKNREPRKHKPDPEHFKKEYRGELESRVGSKMRDWRLPVTGARDPDVAPGLLFPHLCAKCGSGDHSLESCRGAAVCSYPPCKGVDHSIITCPMIQTRCPTCNGLGHNNHKGRSITSLAEQFNAARRVHLIASRLLDGEVAYVTRTNPESGVLDVVQEPLPCMAMDQDEKKKTIE